MIRISHSFKPSKTIDEQLDIFKSRGLIIEDELWAKGILKRVSYYRFTAYTLSLKTDDVFHAGVTFKQIFRLYDFDLKFRLLLLEIIEVVEVSMRTYIALVLADKYDGMGYIDSENFDDASKHAKFIADLDQLLKQSKDVFVKHYFYKYDGEFPIWVVNEVITLGVLSKMFKNMKKQDKNELGRKYYARVNGDYLASWLHALSNLRNICAHYGRTYNRNFSIPPKLFVRDHKVIKDNYKVFTPVYVVKYMINDKTYWNSWVERLRALIDEYTEVDKGLIGFPEDWYHLLKV
ncbi:Abi family protein [Cohnella abietis]|uniref:ABC transporter permease n=1 Tax=Cohnella abietis TaxID=2507935 RepID=A0A3T1DET7_9BACL|nr:Abi family protein [Cohnella abietis]BBI36676.1 ABC transporter permease [Cohnella abietis]